MSRRAYNEGEFETASFELKEGADDGTVRIELEGIQTIKQTPIHGDCSAHP
jgi:hypothetical protein